MEVSDGNINNGWQSYTVKKMSGDTSMIEQFVAQHDIEVIIIYYLSS